MPPSGAPSLTPSPTPSPTPPGAFQSPFGSPLERPLDSPLAPTGTPSAGPPSPTPTERPPTETPTPPPTPFPPGPPSKLGLFVTWYDPQIMELVTTGGVAVIKTLELDPSFLGEVKARSPGTVIVGRVDMRQLNLGGDGPAAAAREAADAVMAVALDPRRAGLVDAWEGFNEPVAGDEGQMRRLAELEVERVRLLAEKGLKAVVGNFGTGQPPLEWWPAFRPALEAAQRHGGYLGLHEYSAPTLWFNTNRAELDFGVDRGDEGWLTLRYRKVYRQFLEPWGLRLPLLMTEVGIDGQVRDRPGPANALGWRDFARYWQRLGMGPDAPGNYVEQLAWLDAQFQLDSYVRGAAIFAMTAFDGWQSFEIRGDAARILQQYMAVHPAR